MVTVKRDMTVINNHRYRQTTFVSKCIEYLLNNNRTYVSPLDSDEYFVVNPKLKQERIFTSEKEPWHKLKPKSVLHFLEREFKSHADHQACLNVPRLLFGSVEDGSQYSNGRIHKHFNISLIETLRWKYHADYDDERNHLQKVILDISRIPEDDEIFTDKAYSVHQPSTKLCAPEVFGGGFNFSPPLPLAVNHYLGSWERYSSRTDKRRSQRVGKTKEKCHHLCFTFR
jgi:hypothetical protein